MIFIKTISVKSVFFVCIIMKSLIYQLSAQLVFDRFSLNTWRQNKKTVYWLLSRQALHCLARLFTTLPQPLLPACMENEVQPEVTVFSLFRLFSEYAYRPLDSLRCMGTFESPYSPTCLLSQPFPIQALGFSIACPNLFLALVCCAQYF